MTISCLAYIERTVASRQIVWLSKYLSSILHYTSLWRWYFKGPMIGPPVSKHWRRVVSHPDKPRTRPTTIYLHKLIRHGELQTENLVKNIAKTTVNNTFVSNLRLSLHSGMRFQEEMAQDVGVFHPYSSQDVQKNHESTIYCDKCPVYVTMWKRSESYEFEKTVTKNRHLHNITLIFALTLLW